MFKNFFFLIFLTKIFLTYSADVTYEYTRNPRSSSKNHTFQKFSEHEDWSWKKLPTGQHHDNFSHIKLLHQYLEEKPKKTLPQYLANRLSKQSKKTRQQHIKDLDAIIALGFLSSFEKLSLLKCERKSLISKQKSRSSLSGDIKTDKNDL